eukprot:CAMPEP_0177192746 /NCGR_PEP_ID=MMETSP0367-20130122/22069_1 /TAXON_ID=447022 ORGANISM="Scrippsiella hangoei-like, Strain SHHI-4" /NCGR_SAMPLE_ID=MMETSP0367 /ASSEMBLY_ACC=CAM_ASM_000362 /LENGTH=50 /DNA_ID=CAMNT_0018640577 /DNA_START=88 /DNA_END=237 /DNA_ORIENTATION=+
MKTGGGRGSMAAGGLEDDLARRIHGLREVLLALLVLQALCKGSAEARDHA